MLLPANSPLLFALETKRAKVQSDFVKRHKFAELWFRERNLNLAELRSHSAKLLTGATLGTALLLTSPQLPNITKSAFSVNKTWRSLKEIIADLNLIPEQGNQTEKENELMELIEKTFGARAVFEMDKNRLPRYRGKIGLEQHLYRYPGDSLHLHGSFIEAGIAPARGAFGYFSETDKTYAQMVEEEKYYVVLQTFLIPNWNKDWQTLKDWYKFRKFLVINPDNGKTVVGVLGDSGPGISTGKHFGGSPEVMAALEFYPRSTYGDVFVLFLDDPNNTIPLGPINNLRN